MNDRHDFPNDTFENDALWQILGRVPAPKAGPRFVDDTVRAARLLPAAIPWWKRLVSPALLAGATATAVLSISAFLWLGGPQPTTAPTLATNTPAANEIAELADSETLSAAAEHLDSFSDTELVSMIGF